MVQQGASVAAGSLPTRLTSFVGRVAELRDLNQALGRQRLLSLVGPGGAGKTRLAVEAAKAWEGERVWYVDLAPLQDDTSVDSALAVATGAPEGPGVDPLSAAARRIGDSTALILLDNCDQIVDGCAQAVDTLLRSCPSLTVLATSREPLRVEGELVVRLPPLSLPDDGDGLDGDAVLLFLDRAQLSPDSGMRDRAGIREICQRLDGMPLAIELAAARATALSVADVVAGLDDRFRLLADGPRLVDGRQRSLAASIQWSYRLLSEAESTVLQRLAVFRSPFTAEAAKAVVADEQIDAADVLPLLARLVEKSFVVVDERDHVTRYRLLETIRAYAGERLKAHPSDGAATRDRHLCHLRETAERMEPVLQRQPPLQWLDRFESELPDIRAAVSWAAETGNADDALRLVGSLSRFWWVRARADGGRVIEQALAVRGGDPRWRAHALTTATLAALARYDPVAIDFGQEAVRRADNCGDPGVAARAHCWLGWTYLYMDLSQARPHLARASELAGVADDPWTEATALNGLVGAEIGRSLPRAKAMADEALALASSHDNRVEACSARLWLATIALAQGRLVEVEEQTRLALPLAESMGDIVYSVNWQLFSAQCALMRGDEGLADDHAHVLTLMAEASVNPILLGYAAATTALFSLMRSGGEEARASLGSLLPAVSSFPRGMYAAWMCDLLAGAALEAGVPEEAIGHAAAAERFGVDADNGWARSRAQLAAARVSAHAGEIRATRQEVHGALEHAARNDDLMTTIEGIELLAQLEAGQQAAETSVRLVAAAAAARARTGYVRPLVGGDAVESLTDELRGRLGDQTFDRAWADGGALTLDEAVALAGRGRGRRGRPATGWDALTPAERRVVALVGEGLTNPQIASRLFVSPDTVKGHVSAAFRKLGVANRAELAAVAVRRGPTDDPSP
jgi:predicted ATPase/DNA-binding CsgD family transcriptional regulator